MSCQLKTTPQIDDCGCLVEEILLRFSEHTIGLFFAMDKSRHESACLLQSQCSIVHVAVTQKVKLVKFFFKQWFLQRKPKLRGPLLGSSIPISKI